MPVSNIEISKHSNSVFEDQSSILSNPLNSISNYYNNNTMTNANRSYIPSSIMPVSDDKNERVYLLERLIGNCREAKDLRNGYLKMILMPEDIDKRKLKEKIYLGKMC
jgi:hypothetical protein